MRDTTECPTEVDILIRNGVVIAMDDARSILYDGAVAVADGRIAAVGPSEELAARYTGRKIIDARHKAVLPGLIDTHHHFLQNFLKGSRDDLTLADWIDRVSSPRIVLAVQDYLAGEYDLEYHTTQLGCVEALKSGITCILNMEWATHPKVIGAYEEAGIRAVHALTLTDVDQWKRPGMILPMDVAMDLADQLIARCQESVGGRVAFQYGLACPNSCSTDLFKEVRALANRNRVGIHVHIAETRFEWDNIHNLFGKTPVRYLYDIGLLGPDVVGAHCIWLSDDDIRILKETGTAVAHNPECNMKVADGVAPIADMLAAGVIVSLGTDSCAVNDNMDMFESMRVAAFLQKVTKMNPAVVSADQVLDMATIGGARALGMEHEIGSLEVEKKADIILVDLSKTHMRPINNIVNNLVYAASAASDVETVIVDGRLVVENHKLLTLDEEETVAQAEEFAFKRFARVGLKTPEYYQIQKVKINPKDHRGQREG
ncbi:MAG: amidohydrolase [Chloroflexi bacterium]|nr:amidohydrolase [Chloroflexota bacterium]MCL5075928.1 amidohydrolase [Chloroflexota bacterium]